MKHFVHSGGWSVEGVNGDEPRLVCRVARGGVKAVGEEVGLGIGPGVRLEPGFYAEACPPRGTRSVLYSGADGCVAKRVAADYGRRHREDYARPRTQGVKLWGIREARILPEGRFRLERVRAYDQESAEWEVVVMTSHGSAAEVEFTERRMSLRRWTELQAAKAAV